MRSLKNDTEKRKFFSRFVLKNYLFLFISINLSILSSVSSYSQDSLSYYLQEAGLNNPGVRARFMEYSAAVEKLPQVSSLPDPELQAGFFFRPMELLGGNEVADIRLMQMFPWFGTLKAAKDEASKMAAAKYEKFRDAKNELYMNVKTSYYKVYRTKKEIEIAEKNLAILHTLEQLVLVKFRATGMSTSAGAGSSIDSGAEMFSANLSATGSNSIMKQNSMGSATMQSSSTKPAMASAGGMDGSMGKNGKADLVNLLRVQMEIRMLENRIALLSDQLKTEKANFNSLLNRDPLCEVFTGDSLTEEVIPDDFIAKADSLVNHPMVKMFQAESEAGAARLLMSKRMGYPMVGLGLNYTIINKRNGNTSMMNGKDMIMPMATITLPIYRKKYKAMRREAEMTRDAASESAREMQNNLQVYFQEALQLHNDANRRIKLYNNLTELADKSLKLLIATYSANGTNFEEILRMQQQLLDYQLKLIEALKDKNVAIAQIVYLTKN